MVGFVDVMGELVRDLSRSVAAALPVGVLSVLCLLWGSINLWTFALWGWDKRCARQHRCRVSERTLLLWCLCGGWLGALVGMAVWRHKLRKRSFASKVYAIIGLWVIMLLYLLFCLSMMR